MTSRGLPIAPLLDTINKKGGLAWLVASRMNDDPYAEPDTDAASETREYARIKRALSRARKAGTVTHLWADDFCIKYLGLHPCSVFGDDWWEIDNMNINENEEAA